MPDSSSMPEPTAAASPEAFMVPLRPPRKRRRPALSCVQCRRRKVKCDRKMPCTQCSQYHNTVCEYEDPEIHARKLYNDIPSSTPNQTHDISISNEPIPFDTPDTTVPKFSGTRSPTANATWGTAYRADYPRSEQQTSENAFSAGTPQSEPSVQELKDRVRKLEAIVLHSTNHAQSGTEDSSSLPKTKGPKLRGSIDKSRFFGVSHWMNTFNEFDQLRSLKNSVKFDNDSELHKLLKKCKEMARVVKANRPISSYDLPDFKSHLPPRETSDQLVQLYFRTFESTYRVLHRKMFFQEYEQYWNDPAAGSTSFVIKLLLVMAIGTVFYDEGTNTDSLRSLAPRWIYSAQSWLSGPNEKARLSLVGVEVLCLLILARQTHSLNEDLLWITIGSLIRTTMSMGLHRDPSHFPRISVFHAEMRRRLWATVIELATQSSLDCGMPPMFSFYDFDCEPPSNYDDADIDEQTESYPPRKADSVFTDSSIQIALLRSLSTRLEICKLINDFRSNPLYEKVLALSTELTSHIRAHSQLYHASQSSKDRLETTHKNLLDLLTRRFLLALHYPFAIQARTDPRFYFSRKMALDAALIMLAYFETGSSTENIPRIGIAIGGMLKEVVSRASTAVSLELITQISEDNTSAVVSGTLAGRNARQPLHDAVEVLVSLARRRIEFGIETNVKGYLFLSIVQAQTIATEKGEDVHEAITRTAKRATEEAYSMLRKQVAYTPVSGLTPALRGDGVNEWPGENDVDWDFLMQDPMIGFDVTDTWLLDSWEDANNVL